MDDNVLNEENELKRKLEALIGDFQQKLAEITGEHKGVAAMFVVVDGEEMPVVTNGQSGKMLNVNDYHIGLIGNANFIPMVMLGAAAESEELQFVCSAIADHVAKLRKMEKQLNKRGLILPNNKIIN